MDKIKKLQKLQLEILVDIDRICKEKDLKYYITGGTLLGAVRHRGFIPWDDDIDIVMPRKDLIRLEEILTKDYSSKYFVQNPRTDKNYWRYITKVRLNGTKMVEKIVEKVDMHHGIFIDIFPLDRINKERHMINKLRAYLGMSARRIKANRLLGNKFVVKLTPINMILYILPSKFLDLLTDLVYQCTNNTRSKYYTSFGSGHGWIKQTFHEDVYAEGIYLEFEGYQFMAPTKWEVILRRLYGDYMKLPPKENRNSGHDIIYIDLGKYGEN